MAILFTAELKAKSGIVKDSVINNWVVGGINVSVGATEVLSLCSAVAAFYNATPTAGGNAVAMYMSSSRDYGTSGLVVRAYDLTGSLDGSAHGSPYAIHTTDLGTDQAKAGLPDQVALVLTLEAFDRANTAVEAPDGSDPGTAIDRPKERHTGRVFIGPLNVDANTADANGASRPSLTGFGLQVRRAADTLADAIKSVDSGAYLGVWSRVDQKVREVTDVSTDDRWDIQRRRAAPVTTRTRLTVQAGSGVEP